MAIAIASNLAKDMGGEPLFGDVSFKLEPRDRMTLAGRNGAGKSTLLRILAGELLPDSGGVNLQKGRKVALHDQRPPRATEATLREYILSGRQEMIELEAELERLEAAMASGDHGIETMEAYSKVQSRHELEGGYRWREAVLAVLTGLGFGSEHFDRRLDSFSGGELTRASLARSLAAKPDLLLLDEPTNHLDIESLEWLETYLVGLDSAVVLVAHDRWFLEAVGTSVLELEAGRGRFFAGPWHKWRQEQAARELALGRAIEKQKAEIERMEKFVERFRYKATKAKQAQARVKQIDKMKTSGPVAERRDKRSLSFNFPAPERAGRFVIKMQDARIEVPGRVLIDDAALQLERDEHVVLVGPNGAGKTTLMETIAGRREPADGKVSLGHNVRVGYLSQHADTAAGEGTVLEAFQRETKLSGQKARDLLGHFLFSDKEVDKRLADISGGEQRRLSLAILVASGANVLVLDEPTNHLDVESREALEDALGAFEGAVLLISHDRALLEAVGDRTLAVEGGELRSYSMHWADYRKLREEREEEAAESAGSNTSAGSGEKGKRSGSRRGKGAGANGNGAGSANGKPGSGGALSKNAKRKIGSIEREIGKAEEALKSLEDELADPANWATPEKTASAARKHERAKQKVEELYESLERAGG
ncbi:MAG: ribosomal protection-like ABC-F family protein [Solirubrobacterales bacterium]